VAVPVGIKPDVGNPPISFILSPLYKHQALLLRTVASKESGNKRKITFFHQMRSLVPATNSVKHLRQMVQKSAKTDIVEESWIEPLFLSALWVSSTWRCGEEGTFKRNLFIALDIL
jgi:hypothetical protein